MIVWRFGVEGEALWRGLMVYKFRVTEGDGEPM